MDRTEPYPCGSGRENSAAVSDLPLAGFRVRAGTWPAAAMAGRMLELLGADLEPAYGVCLQASGVTVSYPAASVAADWDGSGLAALTGRPGGPDLQPAGAPATFARACGLGIELLTSLLGRVVRVDWAGALSDRARTLGLTRGGPVSAGGSARLVRCSDGWCALNLPRAEDLDLVPALTSDPGGGEPWDLAQRWALTQTGAQIEARAELLGLAAGWVRPPTSPRPPWRVHPAGGPTAGRGGEKLVVNLGSLWAAPLCAHLLGAAGPSVADVESPGRPDGSRLGAPAFYQHLHAGHELLVLPLASAAGQRKLADTLRVADVVITGSRPASLARLGAVRDHVRADHDQVWVSITGHGTDSNRIAFGDDAAAAAGLVAQDDLGPVFAGDAIADPLTGLAAALCALACLVRGGSWDVHLALRDVATAAITSSRPPAR